MQVIQARNVSEALYLGLQLIQEIGVKLPSRAGEMLEFPCPVSTVYSYPREKVLFYAKRDANPFFHCLEGLWMLAGRNDVAFVEKYNKRMAEYSDDGKIFHGAYGFRWRNWFGEDQLLTSIERLKTFENDRRTVVAMWDPEYDLYETNHMKDIPCNTHIYFKVRDGYLNMMVCCRSNDMIWGAYGANAVHMAMLLEYMAGMVGVKVGRYTQVSDSLHAYTETLEKVKGIMPDYDPYLTMGTGHYVPELLINNKDSFDSELNLILEANYSKEYNFKNHFLRTTIIRMVNSYEAFKAGNIEEALKLAYLIQATDWRVACVEWLQRRQKTTTGTSTSSK